METMTSVLGVVLIGTIIPKVRLLTAPLIIREIAIEPPVSALSPLLPTNLLSPRSVLRDASMQPWVVQYDDIWSSGPESELARRDRAFNRPLSQTSSLDTIQRRTPRRRVEEFIPNVPRQSWTRTRRTPSWGRAAVRPSTRGERGAVAAYLNRFGYLDDKMPGQRYSEYETRRALREFQKTTGLVAAGELNIETIRQMTTPRCGLPDNIEIEDGLPTNTTRRRRRRPLSPLASGLKWSRNRLTYKFTGYSTKLRRRLLRRDMFNSMLKWEMVSPLRFYEIPSNSRRKADIEILFAKRDHGDGVPFDGPRKVLAHAFFPYGEYDFGPGVNYDLAGDVHMDDDEEWTVGTTRGINVGILFGHELGHALGLKHSNVTGALMYPYYGGYKPNWGLHNEDIKGIQSIYGRGRGYPNDHPVNRNPFSDNLRTSEVRYRTTP